MRVHVCACVWYVRVVHRAEVRYDGQTAASHSYNLPPCTHLALLGLQCDAASRLWSSLESGLELHNKKAP